jgi:molybdopterin molybdotransferase
MTNLLPLDGALDIILTLAHPLAPETVSITAAHDRTLASPVIAAIASPRADSSAMDGYAVRDSDVVNLPARLHVRGESFAGTAEPPELDAGDAVRIFTGAPVPIGADRVVIQENCSRVGATVTVLMAGSGRNIRRTAQDFREGEQLLAAGTRLTPRALVVAAGADVAEFSVVRRPRVAILCTGDELAPPGKARQIPGAIPESLSAGISAMVGEAGGEFTRQENLPDDLAVLAEASRTALAEADVIIVTGGASVGERDHARQMFAEGLELLFSKVAIKPGRPVWLGRVGKSLVLGLPGNPTSALVAARLFLVPLLSGLAGRPADATLDWQEGAAGALFAANGGREALVRAKWVGGRLVPVESQDSSSQAMLAQADVLVRRRVDAAGVSPGDPVCYLDF